MKNILTILLFLSVHTGYAQKSSLIGEWKVVAVDNGEVYYNAKTDSISIISEELKEMYDDESTVKILKGLMKKAYTNNQITFNERGVFTMKTELGGTLEAKYTDEPKRGVIIHESRNSLNEIVKEEMPYKFINGQLHFTMSPETILTLEKVK